MDVTLRAIVNYTNSRYYEFNTQWTKKNYRMRALR